EQMMAAAQLGENENTPIEAPEQIMEEARNEATSIALAMSKDRQTLNSLIDNSTGDTQAKYQNQYTNALRTSGVQRIDLVERFPILTGQFGYTRGDHEPGRSRLRAFKGNDGTYIVYG